MNPRIAANFLVIVATVAMCRPAIAFKPLTGRGSFDIRFVAGSSSLPEAFATEIDSQVPCLKSMSSPKVFILTLGDVEPSSIDGNEQLRLATERANALRHALLNLGVKDKNVQIAVHRVAYAFPSPPGKEGGNARIRYFGECSGCLDLCRGQDKSIPFPAATESNLPTTSGAGELMPNPAVQGTLRDKAAQRP